MVTRYGSHLDVGRTEGGSQDEDDGTYTPAPETKVYDGAVDYQDGLSNRDAERLESTMGVDTSKVDLTLFLKDESKIADFKLGDTGTFTYPEGDDLRIEILGIRRMDAMLFVKAHG